MEENKKNAREIFEMAKEIYKRVEEDSPEIIIDIKDDDYAYKRRCYYFENGEQLYGGISQEENGFDYEWKGPCMIPRKKNPTYTIQSSVDYINSNGQPWGFAKIRIFEENGEIQIRGNRVGSCFCPDYEDTNFIKTPDEELPLALDALKNNIISMHQSITQDCTNAVEQYDTKWVKSLRRIPK